MKDYHIYLFTNIANIKTLVGYVSLKEQFVQGDIIQEAHVLVCLSSDFETKKEILFEHIKDKLIMEQEYTIPEFRKKYAIQINYINEYISNHGLLLSWLEVLQLAVIIEDEEINEFVLKSSIKKLNDFKKIIESLY